MIKKFKEYIKESIGFDAKAEADKVHEDFFQNHVEDWQWKAAEESGDEGIYWADEISDVFQDKYPEKEWYEILDWIHEIVDN